MRILSKLLQRLYKHNHSGPDDYDTDVVGVSHYHRALKQICQICGMSCGRVEIHVPSKLICDDDNPYDAKAVRIDIHNKTVGHLSRSRARQFRLALKSAGYRGSIVACPAIIVGGGACRDGYEGHFGVRIDLSDAYVGYSGRLDLSEPMNETPIERGNFTTLSSELEQVDIHVLKTCEVGDPVVLWTPGSDGNTNRVHIYSGDSVGGQGKIGVVPQKVGRKIISRAYGGLGFESYLAEKTKKGCKICCKLPSQTRIDDSIKIARQEQITERQGRIAELSKKYNPTKKSFSIKIQLPKNTNLREGQRLFFTNRTIDEYVTEYGFEIDFADEAGRSVVAHKYAVTERCQRILKAHFSGYEMTFKILSIDRPDKSVLKCLDSISAMVNVEFHKKTD